MSVHLLINEEQKRFILKESVNDNFNEIIKKGYDFVKEIISKSSEQIGVDLKFLMTWGASIAGFIGPINEFVKGKFPNMNDLEVSLILTGIILTYYFDNKELLNKVLDKIKEIGKYNEFRSILKKSEKLKVTFINFITSLNLALHKIINIMAYTFIIPILPLIFESINRGVIKIGDSKEIAIRLLSFGLLTISGVTLSNLIKKIIKRFSEN